MIDWAEVMVGRENDKKDEVDEEEEIEEHELGYQPSRSVDEVDICQETSLLERSK